jgi:thiosulfate/3-mercaptopyruvate sulfurtransferase
MTPLVNGPIIPVSWLVEHRDDANLKILDVRPRPQYLHGHIPGAIPFNIQPSKLLSSSDDAVAHWKIALEFALRQTGIQPTDTLIAYEDYSGTNAAYAVWLGDVAGLAGSGMLDGGFNAWLASEQPVDQEPHYPAPSDFILTPNENVIAVAPTLTDAIANDPGSVQILDTRSDEEFLGATIPGAKHLEWLRQLNPDGTFKSEEELRRDYVAQGVDLESEAPTATFCGSGMRAANAYVVLKQLGVKRPQTYGPSWSEWGRQPQLPKQRPDPTTV